ncbi:MAG: DUF664 domain-containing protein [Propionibacteriaceae bacterium]|nr:DUF664 domain-containing protein [Propionibacteriaceae bacterium]
MYFPAIHDEVTTMRNYIGVQLQAIRDAAYGLTDAQVRERPLASVFSIAGVIKHCAFGMRNQLIASGALEGEIRFEDFYASFTLADDESFPELLKTFDDLTQRFLDMVAAADLEEVVNVPPAPWYGQTEPAQAKRRYLVTHALEEYARHAGHVDIIREQIDGAKAAELNAAVEGRPANRFVTPWTRD